MIGTRTKNEATNYAWVDGYGAYLQDFRLADNPYDPTTETVEYEAWKDGYYTAAWAHSQTHQRYRLP